MKKNLCLLYFLCVLQPGCYLTREAWNSQIFNYRPIEKISDVQSAVLLDNRFLEAMIVYESGTKKMCVWKFFTEKQPELVTIDTEAKTNGQSQRETPIRTIPQFIRPHPASWNGKDEIPPDNTVWIIPHDSGPRLGLSISSLRRRRLQYSYLEPPSIPKERVSAALVVVISTPAILCLDVITFPFWVFFYRVG